MTCRRRNFAVIACAFAGAVASLRADETPDRPTSDKGTLVIIGGGMTAAMAPQIYGMLADLLPEHGVVGYVPTAGESVKDPANPDSRLSSNLKGRTLKVIDLPADKPASADDPKIAKALEACDAVFFGGGAQSRIVKVFHPGGRDTLASKAVDAILARGGVVAGTSAGAECMTDPMIYSGDSAKVLADPKSLPMGRGMGYFKSGLVDQHFLQRGRFGRLVVAMERTNQTFGFGISEARALIVDRATGKLTTVGPDAVVFIDRSNSDGRKNWRVSLLGNGDTIDGATGRITPGSGRKCVDWPWVKTERGIVAETDPWKKMAVAGVLHRLSQQVESQLVDATQTLSFALDKQSSRITDSAGLEQSGPVGVRMDIEPTPTTRAATMP